MPATPHRTHVIAVVGSDGSGKSTLTADLVAALAPERPTEFLYLGQSSGNIARAIVRVPLIGPALERYLKRRSARSHDDTAKSGAPDLLTALVSHGLSRWRFHKFRKLLALDRQGITIVTDRYPQAEVPGFYFDGPGVTAAPDSGWLIRWIAAREHRLYRRMADHVPALVIRLNVDAETAFARKPDHRIAMLRDKVRIIPTLKFNDAFVVDLDGSRDYPGVFRKALEEARAATARMLEEPFGSISSSADKK